MCAASLIQVLGHIPKTKNQNVLVGFETADDAGVYRINDHQALVQTLDFFTPVVDDPYTFGAIAAANALSDVYAMGGRPITALAIACFPDKTEEMEILARIMLGGAEKLSEADVALLGGHTISDPEIKFGYSVTGLVSPEKLLTNAGACPGDALVLTKPLGIGIITTAIKRGAAGTETIQKAVRLMTTLNRSACDAISNFRCHAATDITGYGLLGHGFEMAEASNVALHLKAASIPFLPEAAELAKAGMLPGLIAKTWHMIGTRIVIQPEVGDILPKILLDPQTSGGLLLAVHPADKDALLQRLLSDGVEASLIGWVEPGSDMRIIVD